MHRPLPVRTNGSFLFQESPYSLFLFFFSSCLQKTSTTVWVRVVDENDNAPEFPEEEYVTVLSEGPDTVGATIATVTAIDPDEELNGTLNYAIAHGNLGQTFRINNLTVRPAACA